MEESLEIYCEKCKLETHFNLDQTISNNNLSCSHCGAKIYWFSCPNCETGYYSHKKDEPCPECGELNNDFVGLAGKESVIEMKIESEESLSCPWCRKAITLGQALFGGSGAFIQCQECKKWFKAAIGLTTVCCFIFMITVGILIDLLNLKIFFKKNPYLSVILLILLLVFGFRAIAKNTLTVEKHEYKR